MSIPPEFPHDVNGDVLKRMWQGGDSLTEAHMIDFCFIFPERRQVLAFAELFDDRDLAVHISYCEARQMWQAKVERIMIPTHAEITAIESALTVQAESLGGEADGWGCFIIPPNGPASVRIG